MPSGPVFLMFDFTGMPDFSLRNLRRETVDAPKPSAVVYRKNLLLNRRMVNLLKSEYGGGPAHNFFCKRLYRRCSRLVCFY